MKSLNECISTRSLIDWAKANLALNKFDDDLTKEEFQYLMQWIGMLAVDTIYINGDKPRLGRIGINLMLFVSLMEFPQLYEEYGLSQFN